MALAKSSCNTYEQSPDQLKELAKNGTDERGARPQHLPSRASLLKDHENNSKRLSEGNMPMKNMILPPPYPPSRVSVRDRTCEKLRLGDVKVEQRDANTVLLVKTITPPYIYSATVTVVEDEEGNVARLTACNLEDSMVDPIIVENLILAVKQPSWSRLVDGGYQISVDHPSDLEFLDPSDDIVPNAWRSIGEVNLTKDETQWKKEGDMMFLKKRFRKALTCYNRGLEYLKIHPNSNSAIDLYRKKCGVNIVLLRIDDAAMDLSQAIATHAASSPELASSPISDLANIKAWLHNHSTEDPLQIASNIPRALKELAARIKFDLGIYQSTPNYDIPLISSYVGPLTLHVDAANYLSDTEVKETVNHGRGLFAKRPFKAGELICAEKAFVLPGYFIQDRSSDCLLYNLGDETATPRPGALLFKELVQKLRWNPSLRKEYFKLDDGGYWKKYGYEVAEGEEIPVDVFRVEKIRQQNSFSVPTRSHDLLHQQPNANPEMRNGFWIYASYINHSCLPNSLRTFIGDIHFLRATRDIAAGEELTHQYTSPDIDIIERQGRFREAWGFDCDCHLCEVDGAIDQTIRNDRRRRFDELKASVMKLGQRGTSITSIKKIARALRELETLYSPPAVGKTDLYESLPRLALVHPTLFLTEAWRGVKNTDKMIEYARKLLRNFGIITKTEGGDFEIVSNAGMVNVEAVRALKYLAEGYTAKEERALASQCMEIAKVWFVVISGSELGMEEFFRS